MLGLRQPTAKTQIHKRELIKCFWWFRNDLDYCTCSFDDVFDDDSPLHLVWWLIDDCFWWFSKGPQLLHLVKVVIFSIIMIKVIWSTITIWCKHTVNLCWYLKGTNRNMHSINDHIEIYKCLCNNFHSIYSHSLELKPPAIQKLDECQQN